MSISSCKCKCLHPFPCPRCSLYHKLERETFTWTQEIAAKIILKYIFVSELQSKPEIANLEFCTTQSNATGCMIVAGTGINCIIAKADHSP